MFGAFDISKQKIVFASIDEKDTIDFISIKSDSNLKEIKQSKTCFWHFVENGERLPVEVASSTYRDIKPYLHSANGRSLVI